MASALRQMRLQLFGDRVIRLARRPGLIGRDLPEDFHGVALERTPARQQLIEDHAEAEDVGAAIDAVPLAIGLLGTHVGGCAAGAAAFAVILLPERQAEIAEVGRAGQVDQDVAGLHIAMDQPFVNSVI